MNPFRLRISRAATMAGASLASMVIAILASAVPASGLDPNKRVTQYIHTSWRTQDGSLPAGKRSFRLCWRATASRDTTACAACLNGLL